MCVHPSVLNFPVRIRANPSPHKSLRHPPPSTTVLERTIKATTTAFAPPSTNIFPQIHSSNSGVMFDLATNTFPVNELTQPLFCVHSSYSDDEKEKFSGLTNKLNLYHLTFTTASLDVHSSCSDNEEGIQHFTDSDSNKTHLASFHLSHPAPFVLSLSSCLPFLPTFCSFIFVPSLHAFSFALSLFLPSFLPTFYSFIFVRFFVHE